jgi:hypothetical protein
MAVGQVSFHSDKKVKRGERRYSKQEPAGVRRSPPQEDSEGRVAESGAAHVPARDNAIVNRLNKTKVEKEVDHEGDRQARLKEEGRRKKAEALERVRTSSQQRGALSGAFPWRSWWLH